MAATALHAHALRALSCINLSPLLAQAIACLALRALASCRDPARSRIIAAPRASWARKLPLFCAHGARETCRHPTHTGRAQADVIARIQAIVALPLSCARKLLWFRAHCALQLSASPCASRSQAVMITRTPRALKLFPSYRCRARARIAIPRTSHALKLSPPRVDRGRASCHGSVNTARANWRERVRPQATKLL